MGGKWKDASPTFCKVVERIESYFGMTANATRFNWYRDSSDWKPFHHDAAAMKPERFAHKQNCTIAASFGATRDVSFLHAKNGCTLDIPQPNGSAYTFGRDVNLEWKHGIKALPSDRTDSAGRISIICWGWLDQDDSGSRGAPLGIPGSRSAASSSEASAVGKRVEATP